MTKLRMTLAVSGIIIAAAAGFGATGPASAGTAPSIAIATTAPPSTTTTTTTTRPASTTSTSANTCQKDYVCLWSGPNYTGKLLAINKSVDFLGTSDLDMNDKVSSIQNRSTYDATLFADAYQGGINVTFAPGESFPNLGELPDFDNTASSVLLWHEPKG